jgi:uncharacterized protein YcfJ
MIRIVPVAGLVVLLTAFMAGCASTSGSGNYDQNYDFSSVKRVAVVAVEGASAMNREAAQNQIASMFNQQLLGKGYSPVERSQVKAVMEEQKFAQSDVTRASGAAQMGKILNVDTAVILNVPKYGQVMEMSAKMVDVESARIIWSANGSAETGKGLNEKAGAVLGAVGGAVAGHQADHGAGAVVGGAAGAAGGSVAGEALTPQRQEQASKLVKKLSESLPSASGASGS